MKKITLLFASVLSITHALSHNDSDKNNFSNHSLVLFPVQQDSSRFSHASHASHYSAAQTYKHSVDTIDVKCVKLSRLKVSEIEKIIEKHFIDLDSLSSYHCSDLKISKCILKSIDDVQVNGVYYHIHFLVSRYSEKNIHSHQYYDYYASEDNSDYYNYRIEVPQRILPYNLETAPLLKQILAIIR